MPNPPSRHKRKASRKSVIVRQTMKTIWKIKNLLVQESLQEVDEREAIEVLQLPRPGWRTCASSHMLVMMTYVSRSDK